MKTKLTAANALIAFAFCAGFSMPLARAFLFVALVLTVVDCVRGKRRIRLSGSALGWLGYVVLALIVTACVAATLPEDALIDPKRGLGKITKLLWYMGALVVPAVVTEKAQFRAMIRAFVIGCAIYAVGILITHLPLAWLISHFSAGGKSVWFPPEGSIDSGILLCVEKMGWLGDLQEMCRRSGAHGSFTMALSYLSGMGPGQRLMAGALAAVGWLCSTPKAGGVGCCFWENKRTKSIVFGLVMVGLLVTLRRGSLLVFWVVGGIAMLCRMGWKKGGLLLVLASALVILLPVSRERLLQIPDEFRVTKGGRALMWTNLAPAMREKYPWGVGFRGLTYKSLRYATNQGWRLEINQNHLHNNFLQVTVELGYLGLAMYLFWMGAAFRDSRRRLLIAWSEEPEDDTLLRAVPMMLLAGLFFNGVVEYNLAEGDVTLIYGLAMGLANTVPQRSLSHDL